MTAWPAPTAGSPDYTVTPPIILITIIIMALVLVMVCLKWPPQVVCRYLDPTIFSFLCSPITQHVAVGCLGCKPTTRRYILLGGEVKKKSKTIFLLGETWSGEAVEPDRGGRRAAGSKHGGELRILVAVERDRKVEARGTRRMPPSRRVGAACGACGACG